MRLKLIVLASLIPLWHFTLGENAIAQTTTSFQCYWQILSLGPQSRADKNRAAYLCANAISTDPAQCYWQVMSLGNTSELEKERATDLCANATSSTPANCYWQGLSQGLTQAYDRDRLVALCQENRSFFLPRRY